MTLDVHPNPDGIATIKDAGTHPTCAVCGQRLSTWRDNDSFAHNDRRCWVFTHKPGECRPAPRLPQPDEQEGAE